MVLSPSVFGWVSRSCQPKQILHARFDLHIAHNWAESKTLFSMIVLVIAAGFRQNPTQCRPTLPLGPELSLQSHIRRRQ